MFFEQQIKQLKTVLQGQKILFFAPRFFGYEVDISQTLSHLGAEVTFFDERPENDFWTKSFLRLKSELIAKKIVRYYRTINKTLSPHFFDYILFVNPEAISPDIFLEIKEKQRNAKTILYLWDSLQNKKRAKELIQHFDKAFSFDRRDSDLQAKIQFRPLFYVPEFHQETPTDQFRYDISFIGTVHSDRYKILKSIQKQSQKSKLTCFNYMYFPSRAMYFFRKLFDKEFFNTRQRDFKFSPISKKETAEVFKQSRALIDIQHPGQTGLTIRTIESIGSRKKLISTNEEIKSYDFFSPNNTFFISRENPEIDFSFLASNYTILDEKIYFKYSIYGWLADLFLT